jgi:hypothetical protein
MLHVTPFPCHKLAYLWIPPPAAGLVLYCQFFLQDHIFSFIAVNFHVEVLVNHPYHNRVNPFRRSKKLLPVIMPCI